MRQWGTARSPPSTPSGQTVQRLRRSPPGRLRSPAAAVGRASAGSSSASPISLPWEIASCCRPSSTDAGEQIAIHRDRAGGVVIARHRIGDVGRVGVAVAHRHDRDVQHVGFLDRDLLLERVDHHQDVGLAAHVLDAAQRPLQLVAVAGQHQQFLLGQAGRVAVQPVLHLAQALDRLGDGLPVGQHAAQPAVVDVVLAAALGRVGDLVGGSALGADEQHAAAGRRHVADRLHGLVQHRNGLLQIDDVNAVAHAEEERSHLRIPAAGVVTKMHASFQELTHGEMRHRHEKRPFPVRPLRVSDRTFRHRSEPTGFLPASARTRMGFSSGA